ncbi:melanoma-associated antigen B5-like [Psammomys obesus]|uniref:melanoma-associated antigen B5-like n=1 Tax=Psammomys obesus TaxID=48139 RepID=UPI00245298F6|nr:melanoma-associated antigen B5-like [Psammomys obesus]
MPRRQRNKHRNRAKNKNHNQEKSCCEGDYSQDDKEASEDSVTVEEVALCSSSSVLEEIPENPIASESSSDTEWSTCVPSAVTVSEDRIAFDESNYCHCGGNTFYSESRTCHENPCKNCLDMCAVLVEQCVLYTFKMKQPITRDDLLNVIDPKYQYRFDEIFKRAFENIETVFAVNVIEIDSTNHFYDLVSKLKLPNKGRISAGRGLPKTGLLMTLLAMIFMKGNSITEEEIWKFLRIMQVFPGRKHFIYREPRKLITQDLVKLKYLEYRQIPNSDPPHYEFLWGPQAYTETTKMKVLEFMARGSDTEPTTFPVQYAEALREENQKMKEKSGFTPGTKSVAKPKPSPCPEGADNSVYYESLPSGKKP